VTEKLTKDKENVTILGATAHLKIEWHKAPQRHHQDNTWSLFISNLNLVTICDI
jgi:hypothetical protein